MINVQELKTIDYIKQLEEENKLLKKQLLKNILSDNTEIVRLNFTIDSLEKEIEILKRKNARLILLCN
ncbi:MAG: hypothetical protein ACI4L1_00645 [Christensenellales bacterium]